jgi:hypothetical protein
MAWDKPRPDCIAKCFSGPKDLADVGQGLAELFNQDGSVGNVGPVNIYGDQTASDSGFAPYSGTGAHLNSMPVNERLIGVDGPEDGDNGEDGCALLIDVEPAGGLPHSNMHGDGGFAIRIRNGVLWNQGESWVTKWGKVTAIGEFEDEKSYSAPSGADMTYYYADCYLCSDSKGRDETRIPVRVFSQVPFASEAIGTLVSYVRDQQGVAWTVNSAAQQGNCYAKARGDWDWVTGYTNKLGYADFQDANDVFGDTAGAVATTYTVYLPATAGSDPNIHTDDVVTYTVDSSGNRVAVSGYLDAKINSIELWGGTTSNIKSGWIEHTAWRGRFPAAYDPDDADYSTLDGEGGSNPIQPTEHSSGAATWSIDNHEFTSSENTTGITVSAHPEITTTTDEITATIDDHAAKDVSQSATGISVGGHNAKDTSSSRTGVDDHSIDAGLAFDAVDAGTNVTNLDDTDFETGEFLVADNHPSATVLEHTNDAHTHTVSAYTHSVTDGGHTHTVSAYTHTIADNTGHEHTVRGLSHTVNDSGHEHTANLAHTGTLPHASEDYRPPYSTVLFIRRVHPDDE